MTELFAPLYDTFLGIYNENYQLIFDHLKGEDNGYIIIGFSFIFIPLVFMLLFYFLYRNPYANWLHWLAVVLLSAVVVWIATREFAYVNIFESSNESLNEALGDQDSGYEEYAANLPYTYAHYNAVMSLVISFIWSMIFRPKSKIQKHLPF